MLTDNFLDLRDILDSHGIDVTFHEHDLKSLSSLYRITFYHGTEKKFLGGLAVFDNDEWKFYEPTGTCLLHSGDIDETVNFLRTLKLITT
jgi:hypothetical protein